MSDMAAKVPVAVARSVPVVIACWFEWRCSRFRTLTFADAVAARVKEVRHNRRTWTHADYGSCREAIKIMSTDSCGLRTSGIQFPCRNASRGQD